MHTLQYIAIRTDTPNDSQGASEAVESLLNDFLPAYSDSTLSWFDWFVIGGGRWFDSDYKHDYSNALEQGKDTKAMLELIASTREQRILDFRHKRKMLKEYCSYSVEELFDYYSTYGKLPLSDKVRGYMLNGALSALINLINEVWSYDSGIYNATEDSTELDTLEELLSSDELDPEGFWYFIPVDFHF